MLTILVKSAVWILLARVEYGETSCLSHFSSIASPSRVTFAKLHANLPGKSALKPLCHTVKDLFAHKFGSCILPLQFCNLVQVFVVVFCEHLLQDMGGLTDINDPVVSLDESRCAEFTIDDVGGAVELLCGAELGALEGVRYHY